MMRDMVFIGYLVAILMLSFKRPFLFVLVYAYVDIIAPQRLSYYYLNSVPVSLIVFGLAFLGYLVADDKKDSRFSARQAVMVMLLLYCWYTTSQADFPIEAAVKWDWIWKAFIFAIFLPLTLRTKLRLEALTLVMVLCLAAFAITGGIKTLASGGGYGVLVLLLDENNGLYEGSILSTFAITVIPLILWLMKYGTIFKPEWRVSGFGYALIFACLLIPVGTQARTGLVCIGVLAVLLLRFNKYRFFYVGAAALLVLASVPFLPDSFTNRMSTIQNYDTDESASTRIAVWKWTWDYAKENPMGGGFDAYRGNSFSYELNRTAEEEASLDDIDNGRNIIVDKGRAYHSSYFEMLGEQGYIGLLLWLIIHIGGVYRMEVIQRRYKKTQKQGELWIAPLASALQNAQIIYLVGALFVGIAFQPFAYMLIALQIGLDTYSNRRRKEAAWRPIVKRLKKSSLAEEAKPA